MDLVIHHNDNDGICSAAIANYFISNDIEFYPMNYGFKTPWNKIKKADRVIMVDFGLQPFSEMIKLHDMKGDKFIWIDHHATAINDYEKSGQKFQGLREIGKAGCELTWRYFSNGLPIPKSVLMMGRYDVWDLQHEDTVPFHYGMLIMNLHPNDRAWVPLLENDPIAYDYVLRKGEIIHKYQVMRYDQYCKPYSFEMEWKGYKFICANALNVSSMLFDGYFDESKHDAMLTFGWTGERWTVSMYTIKDGIDVGSIAKSMGGGGHKGASGFQCNELPFSIKR